MKVDPARARRFETLPWEMVRADCAICGVHESQDVEHRIAALRSRARCLVDALRHGRAHGYELPEDHDQWRHELRWFRDQIRELGNKHAIPGTNRRRTDDRRERRC